MVLLLQAAFHALFSVNLLSGVPKLAAIERVASEAFAAADMNVDEKIEEDEFVVWACKALVSQSIIKRVRDELARRAVKAERQRRLSAPTVESLRTAVASASRVKVAAHMLKEKAQAAAEGVAMAKAARRRSLMVRRASVEAEREKIAAIALLAQPPSRGGSASASADGSDSSDESDVEDGPLMNRGAGPFQRGRPTGRSKRKAAKAASNKFAEVRYRMMMMDRKSRQMQLRAVAQTSVIMELLVVTKFSRPELLKLAEGFVTVAGSKTYLDRRKFRKLMGLHMPHLVSETGMMDRVFAICDKDTDGRIDFGEFCVALNHTLRGDLDEKLAFVFALLDRHAKGCIDCASLISLIRRGNKHLSEAIEFAEEIVSTFDVDGDGDVSPEEFTAALHKEPALLEAFSSIITVPPIVGRCLHRLRTLCPAFTYASVINYVQRLGSERRTLSDSLTLPGLMKVLKEEFGCSELEIVRQVFEEMKKTRSQLEMRDFLTAASQIFTTSTEEQIMFFFRLYDLDGGGTLSRNEIMVMLITSQRAMDEEVAKIVDFLERLDADGDGLVSYDEFMEYAARDAHMMETLSQLFWVRSSTAIVAPGASDTHSSPSRWHKRRAKADGAVPTLLPSLTVPATTAGTSSAAAGSSEGQHRRQRRLPEGRRKLVERQARRRGSAARTVGDPTALNGVDSAIDKAIRRGVVRADLAEARIRNAESGLEGGGDSNDTKTHATSRVKEQIEGRRPAEGRRYSASHGTPALPSITRAVGRPGVLLPAGARARYERDKAREQKQAAMAKQTSRPAEGDDSTTSKTKRRKKRRRGHESDRVEAKSSRGAVRSMLNEV